MHPMRANVYKLKMLIHSITPRTSGMSLFYAMFYEHRCNNVPALIHSNQKHTWQEATSWIAYTFCTSTV